LTNFIVFLFTLFLAITKGDNGKKEKEDDKKKI